MQTAARKKFAQKKASEFRELLTRLRDAYYYAEDVGTSCWEFGLDLNEVLQDSIEQNDLRWMLHVGWIEHDNPSCANSVASGRIEFDSWSRFTLTKAGVSALELTVLDSHPDRKEKLTVSVKPSWNRCRHELSLGQEIVKRFRWPAANQEKLLTAFEEESWPPKIFDPLPPSHRLDPKRRLSDTIKCLNRNQSKMLIRFRGDGTGEGVLWDLTEPGTISASGD